MASLSTSVVASASSRLWQHPSSNGKISVPSASLSLRTCSTRTPFSLSSSSKASSQLLHCSFLSSPLSLASLFSGESPQFGTMALALLLLIFCFRVLFVF